MNIRTIALSLVNKFQLWEIPSPKLPSPPEMSSLTPTDTCGSWETPPQGPGHHWLQQERSRSQPLSCPPNWRSFPQEHQEAFFNSLHTRSPAPLSEDQGHWRRHNLPIWKSPNSWFQFWFKDYSLEIHGLPTRPSLNIHTRKRFQRAPAIELDSPLLFETPLESSLCMANTLVTS